VNNTAVFLLVLAGVAALGDWIAVVTENKRLEYVCKPLTIVFLMGVAGALDSIDNTARAWFVVALFLSMVGDVFLMVPADRFVPGLVSFLLGHLAYIAGMWTLGVTPLAFVVGLAIAALAVTVVGGRILRAVREGADRAMTGPVAGYMAVISLMLASAIGTEIGFAILGAALFYCSDALIAWGRFVRPRGWHRLAIIVTYHLAQAGLVLSLAR
jgi:uncharacterized membrane protein YhhN